MARRAARGADARARPVRIAIIGGGCGSIATAFELTRPAHEGRYQVTVYQQGFRLGGKGASGRGPGNRIEEHGLHIWMGFYENAFRLVRECYAELDRDPSCRFAKWDDVWFPDPLTGVKDDHADGTPSHWLTYFPPGAGTPGDPDRPPKLFTMAEYFVRAMQLVEALLTSARRDEILNARFEPQENGTSAVPLLERVSRLLRIGQLSTVTGAIEAMHLARMIAESPPLRATPSFRALVDLVGSYVTMQLNALVGHDTELRRIFEIVDLTLTAIRGSIRSGLVSHPDGFDAISDCDWREWLRKHGASELAVNSSFLHSLYNIAFAYEDGDPTRPSAGAGEALRCAMRAFLGYRGAFFWKMRTGMGDAVFAPFYEVLKRRGVRFEFFHRLENVGLSPPEHADPPRVERLEFDVQAHVIRKREYQPLVDVRGVPCWPAQPLWEQLHNGDRLRDAGVDFESFWDRTRVAQRSLEVGRDFDAVVLGVGLGAVPYVANELIERFPHWRLMVRKVKTTATKALQLWVREPISKLGWEDASVNLTGVPGPFETWADMSQLIDDEDFPRRPGSIAYFCSAIETPPDLPSRDDTDYPLRFKQQVQDDAARCLEENIAHVWPNAVGKDGFRWELLVDGNVDKRRRTKGRDRLASQFMAANVNPSDRYVLFVPNSARFRISPLDYDVSNMTIAGDWTDCGLNVGCVEAAIMSGRLAAHAISTEPPLEDIVGFDHP
jgi:uncharacterized protein with NAD-binding domain and iron-sulfur cluster